MIVMKIIVTLLMVPVVLWTLAVMLLLGSIMSIYWRLTEGDWCKEKWTELLEIMREGWDAWKDMMSK